MALPLRFMRIKLRASPAWCDRSGTIVTHRLDRKSLRSTLQPVLHRVCVHQACLLELKSTAREDSEIRNALDVVSCGQLRVFLRIDFEHYGPTCEISSDLGNMRRRHPAWAAPGCPKIDKDRDFAVANNFVKLRGADLDGFSHRG